MSNENVVWAFFSAAHYQQMIDEAKMLGKPTPKDVYYKDVINGKWLIVTSVYDCIEEARRNYRFNDLKYLGPVDKTTKAVVDHGKPYPPPEPKVVAEEKPVVKKKKIKKPGEPGTVVVKKKLILSDFEDYGYPLPKAYKYNWGDDDNY